MLANGGRLDPGGNEHLIRNVTTHSDKHGAAATALIFLVGVETVQHCAFVLSKRRKTEPGADSHTWGVPC